MLVDLIVILLSPSNMVNHYIFRLGLYTGARSVAVRSVILEQNAGGYA